MNVVEAMKSIGAAASSEDEGAEKHEHKKTAQTEKLLKNEKAEEQQLSINTIRSGNVTEDHIDHNE